MKIQIDYNRRFLIMVIYTIIIFSSITNLNAQIIFQESFNSADGTTSGTANGINWSSSCPTCLSGDYWEVKAGVFEGNDTNGEAIWETTSPIDISNCNNIEIDFSIESVGSMEGCGTGCNSVDWVRFQYNIDGNGWVDPSNSSYCSGACGNINVVASDDTPLMTYSTGCIPNTGSNLQIRISVQTWAGSEYWRIDDVTVNCSSSNAGSNGNLNICSTSPTVNLFNQLGGNPANNGTWTGASALTGGNLGTFNPTTMNAGIYTYTVGTGTCQESSTVTVNINSTGNAGNNNTINLCDNSATLNLFDQLGGNPDNNGIWSGASTLTGGNLGTFNPTTMNAGIYTYTAGTGTCQGSSAVTVNINSTGNAGNNNTINLCDNSATLNLFDQLGGNPDNNGIWSGASTLTGGNLGTFNPTTMNAGIYTYTVGTGTCQESSTVTVNINSTGNAGNNNTINLCDNSATLNLFDQLGGNPANNGTWTGASTLTGGNLGTFDPASMMEGIYIYNAITVEGCLYTDQIEIEVNNLPSTNFTADFLKGCESHLVNFNITSNTTLVDCLWEFGDGNTSNQMNSASNLYTSAGIYSVTLTVTDENGCVASNSKANYIEVMPNPITQFSTDPITIPIGEPDVNFTNESSYANNFTWDFGDDSPKENNFNAFHTFKASNGDSFMITLIALNENGCSDTAQFELITEEKLDYFIPNAFTPNGDKFNNNFKPIFTSEFDPMNYQLQIYNRWGEIIFESNNAEIGWDGSYDNRMVEEGVYIWIVRFKGITNSTGQMSKGMVNLIR
ncbi:T9SS type B sorting domain-containing protein [Brumimicrobium glaciale]|uniref:T9SS type B sorting domain-containing protein n=1 Tax=Brumimicrobium glaciale TaxID=200475 RepID=A0A4Q4KPX4_9FLAO|nr:PKD domain-containing protein [Brumimicrobium glaciale]RYM34594.1 T9SS type B sorting domain-containing protein [Brumimicrobium glaciale]